MNNENNLILDNISDLCENIREYNNSPIKKNISINSNLSELSSNSESNSPRTCDIFLSHSWDNDNLHRDNHKRVKKLYSILISHGYSVWLDEKKITHGNIDMSMINGINNCKCFVVCITNSYIQKINNSCAHMNLRSNCFKEFNYANILQKPIIPLIFETFINFEKLPGLFNFYLGNNFYYNFSDNNFQKKEIQKLCKCLKKLNIQSDKESKIINNKNTLGKRIINKIIYI
jgi:hypothetical protein